MQNINFDSTSAQNYLSIVQGVINRMAGNSASSKTWCITLVSAIIVFAYERNKPDAIQIALIPFFLCFVLDTYYLALERHFISIFNEFVKRLRSGTASTADLYVIKPPPPGFNMLKLIFATFSSVSIWPFYSLLLVTLIIMRIWLF